MKPTIQLWVDSDTEPTQEIIDYLKSKSALTGYRIYDQDTKKFKIFVIDETGNRFNLATDNIKDFDPNKTYSEGELFFLDNRFNTYPGFDSGIYRSDLADNSNLISSWEIFNFDASNYRTVEYVYQKVGVVIYFRPQEDCFIGENILFINSSLPEAPSFIKGNLLQNCEVNDPNLPSADIDKVIVNAGIEAFTAFIEGNCENITALDISKRPILLNDGNYYDLISCPMTSFIDSSLILDNSTLLANISKPEKITTNNNSYKVTETATGGVFEYYNENGDLVSKPVYRKMYIGEHNSQEQLFLDLDINQTINFDTIIDFKGFISKKGNNNKYPINYTFASSQPVSNDFGSGIAGGNEFFINDSFQIEGGRYWLQIDPDDDTKDVKTFEHFTYTFTLEYTKTTDSETLIQSASAPTS